MMAVFRLSPGDTEEAGGGDRRPKHTHCKSEPLSTSSSKGDLQTPCPLGLDFHEIPILARPHSLPWSVLGPVTRKGLTLPSAAPWLKPLPPSMRFCWMLFHGQSGPLHLPHSHPVLVTSGEAAAAMLSLTEAGAPHTLRRPSGGPAFSYAF